MRRAQDYSLAHGIIGLFLVSACSSTATLDFTIKETDRGAVYLERSVDRSLHAAHPIKLSPETMTRLLHGVAIQEEPGLLRTLVGGKSEPVRVFKEEEVQFLAPLLVEGLAKAASDQHVGFRLGQARASAEIKSGALYAYGRSLYLTLPWLLLESRHGAGGRALSKTIVFTPESARRPDSYRRGPDGDTTVIIDYELLASVPESSSPVSSVPAPPAAISSAPTPSDQAIQGTDAQLRSLQEQMRERNTELEELKKELQEIRKQLLESRESPAKGKKNKSNSAKDAN